jgi:1-deoxy-D-xylulose-5-phosphate reductoisomerase
MNKGLEVIEAKWLFSLQPDQIEVIIHPQSIVHSLVQFMDGSMKAQMGLPDMKLPILFALGFPSRILTDFPRFSFSNCKELTFEPPDREIFRNLNFAYEALHQGGNMPCVLNAANEVAVSAFLEDRISFLEMSVVIEKCMENTSHIHSPVYEDYVHTHEDTQRKALEYVDKIC